MHWKSWSREAAICASILAVLGLLLGVQRSGPSVRNAVSTSGAHQGTCAGFSDAGNIAVAVRTSATHAFARLPIQLMTSLVCVKQPLVFSDLDQTLGKHRIRDVLTRVSGDRTGNNPDFEIYWKQKHLMMLGRETEVRSLQDMAAPDEASRSLGLSASDVLSRYVRLHMVDRAWELQPEREWYVFIEDDTFLVWTNLISWLGTLDPNQKHFLIAAPGNDHVGARSGSAFILSRASMRVIGTAQASMGNRWDDRVRSYTSINKLMVSAISEELTLAPTYTIHSIAVRPPHLMPFNQNNWCKPLVALSQVPPRVFDALYKYQLYSNSTNLRYRDVYNATALAAGLPFKRHDWDNVSNDPDTSLVVIPNERPNLQGTWEPKDLFDPHRSFEACEFACIHNYSCYQHLWTSKPRQVEPSGATADGSGQASRKRDLPAHTECHLSSVFRLGEQKEKVEGEVWVSGWRNDRIARLGEAHVCASGPSAGDWE